jgi:hypothetical protein
MRNTIRRMMKLQLGVLLLLAAPAERATGYYAPGLQRWINRDPIGEDGGKNLYGFVHRNPVSLVDPDGRIAPIIIVGGAVAAWAAWQGICATMAANQSIKAFPADDKKKHCFTSCYHNRCTALFQPAFTLLGGILFEFFIGVYDFKDIQADAYGLVNSYFVWESCKKGCDRCPIK